MTADSGFDGEVDLARRIHDALVADAGLGQLGGLNPSDVQAIAKKAAARILPLAEASPDFQGKTVFECSVSALEDTLRIFAKEPQMLVDSNLDTDRALAFLKTQQGRIGGNHVNLLHDEMTRIVLAEVLDKAFSRPSFQMQLWRKLLTRLG